VKTHQPEGMPSLDLVNGCYTDFEVVKIMNPRAKY
jgi:hypothetical protein